MKKLLSLVLLPLILFSSCDWKVQANIFSGIKNIDNITVLEAIASGDDNIMTEVYERESSYLLSLSASEDRITYNEVRLGIADLQAVRSKAILVFLVLMAIEISDYDVEEVIDQSVIEQYIYEVFEQVRIVLNNQGKPTITQLFMAVLGILVWWYYIAEDLGTTPSDMITAYKADGDLTSLPLDFSNIDYDQVDLEVILGDDIDDLESMLLSINENPDLEYNPELKQAIENTIRIYGLFEL